MIFNLHIKEVIKDQAKNKYKKKDKLDQLNFSKVAKK